jgi:hypothetical protein
MLSEALNEYIKSDFMSDQCHVGIIIIKSSIGKMY